MSPMQAQLICGTSIASKPFASQPIASEPPMTDETYTTLLLGMICTLSFICGMVALIEHPEWFGS